MISCRFSRIPRSLSEMVRLQMENQKLKKDKSKLDALVGRIGNDVLQKLLSETPKEQPKHKEKSL